MASVLIVDDDEAFGLALGRLVREIGHTDERATDGQDGLAKFAAGDFDLVIADLKMPRMNGVEFVQRVRALDSSVPVLVVTGYADLATAVDTLTLGVCDYLEKPLAVEAFRAALERGLELREQSRQLSFARGMVWTVVLSTPVWMLIWIAVAAVAGR